MLNRAFHGPFAIRILDATRIRDDAVMREQRRIHRIQFWLVQIGTNDARFQIVEDDVLRSGRGGGICASLVEKPEATPGEFAACA